MRASRSEADLYPPVKAFLERLGYEVYDYAPGKLDWIAHALPTEGERRGPPRVRDTALAAVPTCQPDEHAETATQHARARGWDASIVVNDAGVILGRLRARDAKPGHTAEHDMQPGPTTIRPSEELHAVHERMRHRGVPSLLVATPASVLLGALEQSTPVAPR